MIERKMIPLLLMLALSVSLISAALTAVLVKRQDSRAQFRMLGDICRGILEERPEAERTVLAVLKQYKDRPEGAADENILLRFGYAPADFCRPEGKGYMILAAAGSSVGICLLIFVCMYWHKSNVLRIKELTDYLEKVNTGKPGTLFQTREDAFSGLQDEIYKTVTMLYQTGDAALKARERFAENLSNIAHQLKTPITAISLSVQMMAEQFSLENTERIKGQIRRLTHLEEALLLLSRIDAGTLSLEKKPMDVFTLLTLAADQLDALLLQARVSVDIPEMGEVTVAGDMEWTMEAVMNLLKNCMEHTPEGGSIHCFYEQNPLYTEIRIWDEGEGFEKKDLPHLFERFYCGGNAGSGGIGIGLSLAKEIIEMQNGIISAGNLPEGGACFEIRIYSH